MSHISRAVLFFIGLVVYLSEIHQTTMVVTAAIAGFTLVVYGILTVLPLWSETCPMVTPFTRIISAMHRHLFEPVYTSTGFKKLLKAHVHLLGIPGLYKKLPARENFFQTILSIVKQRLLRVDIQASCRSTIGSLRVINPSTRRPVEPQDDQDWVMEGCPTQVGGTISRPLPEDSQHVFRALAWILNNSTDRETIKEVLDYILDFPEVILDSSASSEQLYQTASMVVEHLSRFQHDVAEWRPTLRLVSLSKRLIYLTTRQWLHQSTDDGSIFIKLQELSYMDHLRS